MKVRMRRRSIAAIAASLGALGLSGCIITPGNPGPTDVTFTINATTNNHPISPLIYGANGGANLGSNKFTVLRQGGNRWTAYNWENNYSNAGSDWYYENDNFLSSSTVPGAALTPTIDRATSGGAAAIVTIPIVDYVAGDANGGNQDVRNTPNYLTVRMKQNKAVKGSAFTLTPNATDGAVYQDEFVNWLKTSRPNANIIISLDNEPDLWGPSTGTHPEVHPNPVGYAEIVQRNTDYAKTVKAVWPTVKVTGPVNYGFLGMETLQNAPDAAGRNFTNYYLDSMKAAETAAGKRLLDYYDVHWYPETSLPARAGWPYGVRVPSSNNDPDVVAAREQSARSLYSSTYVEPNNWVTDPSQYNFGPINLIPRLKAKIAAHYPGTKLAITEWNFGGGAHISGAIASADVLGVFGRESVDLATLWELGDAPSEAFTYAAFRAYRNYDGLGSTFGDTSVTATSSDDSVATVYASKFAATPNKMVITAINKANTAKTAGIVITCSAKYTKAKVYTITAGGGANLVAQADLTPAATNAFKYTMPAQSVSVIVPQ
jgi:hypothetical protein